MRTSTSPSFSDLLEELPSLAAQHARTTAVYGERERIAREIVNSSHFTQTDGARETLGGFGEIALPYFRMGAVDTLDLFGLDELIIFSFYWTNRNRYRRAADIGANLGLHSILMSKCGWEVDAYEPDPAHAADDKQRGEWRTALDYMGLTPGMALSEIKVDRVFIGSCTNSRIEDLRAAAQVARLGKAQVPTWVVPGSQSVRRQAEAEGLDRIFIDAGFEWRDPGCSLCTAINGDQLEPGERCISTSNRNFRNRQGPGGRTHLASPAMAAAAAIKGRLTDVRTLIG